MRSEFQSLLRRQVSYVELIEMLRKVDEELASTGGLLRGFARSAVALQLVLMCGNVILNFFPAPTARTLYQRLVLVAVEGAGYLGGGTDEAVFRLALDRFFEAIEKTAAKEFVPGVKVVFGLMEDLASLKAALRTEVESKDELNAQAQHIRNQIGRAQAELMRIRSRVDDLTSRAQRVGTTA